MVEFPSMEEYDLSTPVNVTLIFDEDEDIKPTLHVFENETEIQETTETATNTKLPLDTIKQAELKLLKPISDTRKRTHENHDIKLKTNHVLVQNNNNRNNLDKTKSEEAKKSKISYIKKRLSLNKNNDKVYSLNVDHKVDNETHNDNPKRQFTTKFGKKINNTISGDDTIAKTNRTSLDMPLLNEEDDFLQNSVVSDDIKDKSDDKINNNSQPKVDFTESEKDNINLKIDVNGRENKKNESSKETAIPQTSKSINSEQTVNTKIEDSVKIFDTSNIQSTPNQQKKTPPWLQNTREKAPGINNINNTVCNIQEKNAVNIEQAIKANDRSLQTSTAFPELAYYDTTENIKRLLLENVSEHLVNIWTARQSYLKLPNFNNDENVRKTSKNVFMYAKQHFFDLSYSSTINIILPRENDITFIQNFIDSTVRLAHSQSHYTCSHRDIDVLLKDLLNWVRKRKQKVERMQAMMNNVQPSHPLLQQMLGTTPRPITTTKLPPKYPNTYKVTNNNFNTSTPTNTFQSFPYQNTLPSINSVIPQQRRPRNQIPPLPYSKPPYHHNSQSHYQLTPETRNQVEDRSRFSQQQETILGRLNGSVPSVNYIYNQNLPQSVPAHYVKPAAQALPMTAFIDQIYDNITLPWQSGKNRKLNSSQNNQPPCPEYSHPGHVWAKQHRSDQIRTDQLLAEQARPELLRLEQLQPEPFNNNAQPTEPQRSSLSRDSGFMSPLNFNGTNDQPSRVMQEEQGAEVTPLITHVTSLNSSVSYIREGYCCVCGKSTKTMCLGCYACYYCSPDCQYRDWKTHEAICKTIINAAPERGYNQ